jgi:hypothetical protein
MWVPGSVVSKMFGSGLLLGVRYGTGTLKCFRKALCLCREIQELLQEKMLLEREVQDQEYNIQARKTEAHSLQVGSIAHAQLHMKNRGA